MKKIAFLTTLCLLATSSTFAQVDWSSKNFVFEVNTIQTHSLQQTAVSIFPDATLKNYYAPTASITAALCAGEGFLGIKYGITSFETTSSHNELANISYLAIDARKCKNISNNFEVFLDVSMGALFIDNTYQISEQQGNLKRYGCALELMVGIDYSFKKYYVGILGGLSEQCFAGKPKGDIGVPITDDYYLNFGSTIGLCFGIRL